MIIESVAPFLHDILQSHDFASHAQISAESVSALSGFLVHACGLLFEIQRATLPLKSFVANPHVSLADLNLLPAEILRAMPEEHAQERERLRGTTVADVVAPKDIEKAPDEVVTLSYGGFRQSFWEAARADFNGDGVEDILVFTTGSFRHTAGIYTSSMKELKHFSHSKLNKTRTIIDVKFILT
jgi:hypothetical protein